MYICICNNVSKDEVTKLLDEGKTLEEIVELTKATTGCGTCINKLRETKTMYDDNAYINEDDFQDEREWLELEAELLEDFLQNESNNAELGLPLRDEDLPVFRETARVVERNIPNYDDEDFDYE